MPSPLPEVDILREQFEDVIFKPIPSPALSIEVLPRPTKEVAQESPVVPEELADPLAIKEPVWSTYRGTVQKGNLQGKDSTPNTVCRPRKR